MYGWRDKRMRFKKEFMIRNIAGQDVIIATVFLRDRSRSPVLFWNIMKKQRIFQI